MRTKSSLALAVLAFFSINLAAQQTEKFRSQTNLVLVPVVAHDKSGKHVGGLTKERFKLLQDGKEQPIGVFEEVRTAREYLVPVEVPPGEFGNTMVNVSTPKRLTVIALDLINTPVLAQNFVKDELLKYVAQMAASGDPTALVTLSGGHVRVVYDFTTNPKALAAAAQALRTRQTIAHEGTSLTDNARAYLETASAPADITQEGLNKLVAQLDAWYSQKMMADVTQRFKQRQARIDTLLAIQELAVALKSFPGRKSLIWVTAGMPFSEETMQFRMARSAPSAPRVPCAPPPPAPTTSTGTGSGAGAGNQSQASRGSCQAGPNAGGTDTPMDEQTAVAGDEGMPARNFSQQLELMRGVPSTEALNDHQRTWGILNDANVAVYPVDARGVVNTAFETAGAEKRYSSLAVDREMAYFKAQDTITTFENMAAATGGHPCYNRTDLANCFREAVDDGDSYYMLGYYIAQKTKVGWHKLQVKTETPNVNLRTRNGFIYSDTPPDARPAVQADVLTALNSSMNAIALPFRGAFAVPTERNGKKALPFELHLAWDVLSVDQENGNRLSMDFLAVAFTPSGETAAKMGQTVETRLKPESMTQLRQGGLRYKNLLELPPGQYNVRFVVRDNLTGRLGSVTTVAKVD